MTRLLTSLGLAFDIVKGSFRLIRSYPVLIVPLLPVFLMVLGVEFSILFFAVDLIPALIMIFVVAFELMLSFALTSTMIKQIHEGEKPSLGTAITAKSTLGLLPRVFLLSIVWFAIVLILVGIEMAINSLLSRSRDGGAKAGGFVRSVFGTVGDALRMMGFMMVPIMLFEETGLSVSYKRLRGILTDSPITALGGLALTKVATTLVFLAIAGFNQVAESLGFLGFLAVLAISGIGWTLSLYLEQIFVTGLYLYSALPESPVVEMLLAKHIGNELPRIPAPGVANQPTAS